jgi:transcriptional regulator with XRE-family HTH domain
MNRIACMPASTAEAAELLALKRTFARALRTKMKAEQISVTSFAKRIGTHRTAIRRILDENNTSITLLTMFKTTRALGLQLDLSTKPMSPAALGRLGEKLVQAPEATTAKTVTEALVAGFYGRPQPATPTTR